MAWCVAAVLVGSDVSSDGEEGEALAGIRCVVDDDKLEQLCDDRSQCNDAVILRTYCH